MITTLLSPISRQVLARTGEHVLSAIGERWPVIEGIPYLRTGRDALVTEVLRLIDLDRVADATVLLLGDQDDWARAAPASLADRRQLLEQADRLSFRAAMDQLAFGAVGTYFAHRWSDPTFLSGLALIEAHWRNPHRVVELACGAGHFLREFIRTGAVACGADVVWAKLWLARRYVAPTADLICFDAAQPWPLPPRLADLLFCHDAFYFLPEKPSVVAEMQRVTWGPVLVGHAHNGLVENLSAGAPLSPAAYAALFDQPALYDDAELTHALIERRAPVPAAPEALTEAAAISIAAGAKAPRAVEGGVAMPPLGAVLRRNPLYQHGAIAWPSPRYQTEYAPLATYPLDAEGPDRAVAGDPEVETLVRRRALVDLPERW